MSSAASSIASLRPELREKFLSSLSDRAAAALLFDWSMWARPEQLPPPGAWSTWALVAGRGFGKTRTGAEWIKARREEGARRIALIAPTAADARDVMVEGPSGILATSPPWDRPIYEPSRRRLTWPDGAVAFTYSAEEPDRLRGPEHDTAWGDELAAWKYSRETYDMLTFGLRAGPDPRALFTTTPRPIKVLKEIIQDPDTKVTRGSTYDNAENLSAKFVRTVVKRYEGTRLGRQELHAQLLDDVPGALWTADLLATNRVAGRRDGEDLAAWREHWSSRMRRIVVSVDPAATSDPDTSEHGVIVSGVDAAGEGYVLQDASRHATPEDVCRTAIMLYDEWRADKIIGEVNNGGDWIGTTVEQTAKAMHREGPRPTPVVNYGKVHASRGKHTRAEPISALDEQGRVHHVGYLAELEDQMCNWDPMSGGPSPDRMDARVWGLTELMLGRQYGMLDVL